MKLFIQIVLVTVLLLNPVYAQTINFTYDANGNCTSKRINGTQPDVKVTGDTVVCKGTIAKFTATGADSYVWAIGGSSTSVSVIADTTRTYKVVGTNNVSGCNDTAYHLLRVLSAPDSNAIWGDTVATIYSIDTFNAPVFAGSNYQWTVTNGTILGGNSTPQIIVQWSGNVGKGVVELYQSVNNQQCKGKTVFHNVNIKDYPASIETLNVLGVLRVYPNPANAGANVLFTPTKISECQIIVSGIDGRVIYRTNLGAQASYSIFLEDSLFLSSGTYSIKIISEKGQVSEKLVYIKQ